MNSHSRYRMNHPYRVAGLLVLAAVLLASLPMASAEPSSAALPGEEINLRSVPQLQQKVSGEFFQPSAVDLLNNLRQQTGLNLTLDKSVIQDRPIQGFTKFQAPAWGTMQALAENKYVRGRWRKVGDEYRLFATYKGSLPPRPPEVPPQVVNAIKNNTAVNPEHVPTQRPRHFSTTRKVLTIGSIVFLTVLLVWRVFFHRSQGKKDAAAKTGAR